MSQLQTRWAVLGGGFLGMTMALRLAQQGKDVTLFEAAGALGGLASAWSLGDVIWDRHYHVTLQSDTFLHSLLRELGLEQKLEWGTTRTGFYTDRSLHSLSSTLEFLRFPALSLIDKLRLGATIVHASRIKNGRSLEGIRVADWLGRWSGQRVLERIWLPLLRAKLGESYRETSAAFIWATIARMYAARRSGMKKEVFGYVPGGYAHVIEQFAKILLHSGVRCELGGPVKAVRHQGTCVRVDMASGTNQVFDHAVLTMAAPLAARLCPELTVEETTQLNGVKYLGIICASLLLKEPLSDYYITNIADGSVPFTAVIEMSALVDRKNFGGHSLVYLPKYVASNGVEFELSDAQIQQNFLDALAKMYANFKRENLLCFQVSRVKYLLPLPTLNYSERLPAMATSIPGVHIVNSSHIVNGTLNVNETVQLAERAAKGFANFSHPKTVRYPVQHAIPEAHRQPVA